MTPEQQVEYINRQDRMNRIKKVAEMYANATPEQRAKVDASTVKSLINEYRELQEMQRQAEDMEQRAQLEAMRAQEEAQRAAAQWVGWGRRVVKTTPVNTEEQYINYVTPILYEYEWPTSALLSDWNAPQWNIDIWVTNWVPYYYDKTTWVQVAPIWTNNDWTVIFSNWQTLRNIQWDIDRTLQANVAASNATHNAVDAREYADKVRNQTIWWYMLWTAAGMLWYNALTPWVSVLWNPVASNVWRQWVAQTSRYISGRWMWEPMTQSFRNTATRDYANGFTRNIWSNYTPKVTNVATSPTNTSLVPVSEGNIVNPTYGNQYSTWAQNYLDTVNKTKNLAKWFNTSGYIPKSRAINVIPGNASNYIQTSLI